MVQQGLLNRLKLSSNLEWTYLALTIFLVTYDPDLYFSEKTSNTIFYCLSGTSITLETFSCFIVI